MDYARLIELQQNGDPITFQEWNGFATLSSWIARTVREDVSEAPSRGPVWFANFSEHKSFKRDRDLLVTQLNGDHRFEALDGLYLSWAANYAKTTQDERAQEVGMFFEPDDLSQIPTRFPVTVAALGPGSFVANNVILSSENDIDERQGFGRLDAEYERELAPFASLVVTTGGWYEHATRDVDSSFLESPSVSGSSQFALFGDTPQQLGSSLFGALDRSAGGGISGVRHTTNDSTRDIRAWNAEATLTLWEDFDALGGLRYEDIEIESNNAPFTGEDRFGAPDIFPTRYLLFDRLDNPARGEVASAPPPGTTFNDQILGISVPVDPVTGLVDLLDRGAIESLVNGEIDETELLPAAGIAYRPIDGLSVRGAYSRTVARPSFREMGFYVSLDPTTDDVIVGNPQLGLSDVESIDGRIEYLWGDLGDLAAFSAFYKTIDDPIESIVVRDPLNFEATSALFRTFFNNPSQAELWGIEAEARKSLGFLGPELLDYFSIGGNYTYIDAEVDRSPAELARAQAFFRLANGDTAVFRRLSPTRRLFAQPEWIANADFTIDHPDWGTRLTLAVFAISDVLDAAGSAVLGPDGDVKSATLDRYIDSYYQLDLIASQDWRLPRDLGVLTFKLNVKNLTDTTRRIVYDPDQTVGEYVERAYKIGRDFSFSIEYSFSY
jgi:outer membrane receptor protein involved in Fe transport